MSDSSHQLTAAGRLVINLVIAIALYALLHFTPEFQGKELLGLLVMAVAASITGGLKVTPPAASVQGAVNQAQTGEIKWFNATKGFGFITGDDGNEVFVHYRNVEGVDKRRIKPGQRISYVTVQSDRGPQAEDVKPL